MADFIEVATMLGAKSKEGVVTFRWGQESGILTPDEAREHAVLVLAAAEAAETDELLVRFAHRRLNLNERQATILLRDFRALRGEGKSKVPVDIPQAVKTRLEDA